jgi:hypothetical protein
VTRPISAQIRSSTGPPGWRRRTIAWSPCLRDAGGAGPPRQASAEAASGNRCSPRSVCRTRMCGLTSRTLPVTVYIRDLSATPASLFPVSMSERSDSSRRPRTAAFSSDLRANRVGLAESVTSSHQREMSAKCRTCPPWDCIGLDMTLLGATGRVKSFRHLHCRGHTDTSLADSQARPPRSGFPPSRHGA